MERDYAELIKALRGCCSELRCPDCYLWENGSCKWQMRNDAADAIEELLATVNHLESCIDRALDALDRGADNDWARDALEKAAQFPEPPKEGLNKNVE